MMFLVLYPNHDGYLEHREDKRRAEIEELVSQGKIPHEQELEKHPEKSVEGRSCKNLYNLPLP
jgi:hypothetical protein